MHTLYQFSVSFLGVTVFCSVFCKVFENQKNIFKFFFGIGFLPVYCTWIESGFTSLLEASSLQLFAFMGAALGSIGSIRLLLSMKFQDSIA